MLEADAMYPEGFHPASPSRRIEDSRPAPYRNRADVISSVVYYFTDFGISTYFKDPTKPRLVTGKDCQDKEVPELSDIIPYDPFKTDVFILGNLYKTTFTNVRHLRLRYETIA